MPSTHTCLLYHVIFATKNRRPTIATEYRARLDEYLGGTVRGLGGISYGVGGVEDHTHLLLSLRATHRLSDFMRDLKKSSSSWMRESVGIQHFAWQEGYAAFSVSASIRPTVQRYIARQKEHHRRKSFREELINFLQSSDVEYDDRFID